MAINYLCQNAACVQYSIVYMITCRQQNKTWIYGWAWFFSHRNIRLLRSHQYSYTNTPLRKAVKAQVRKPLSCSQSPAGHQGHVHQVCWVLILRSIYKFTSSWATNCFKRSRYCPYSSTSLCPAPSTHSGSTGRWQRSYRASPWEKSITSSSVPWITSTGEVTLEILSMLREKKKNR